jgi:hypothetical protein
VRLPSGARLDRVFKLVQTGQDVFAWVSRDGAAELKQGQAELPYSLSAGASKLKKNQTLKDQGITGPTLMTVFID